MSDVKVTTLDNGLRVPVDEMPEVESASLGVWVGVGTRHEAAELNGVAHMLEHMAFKGTRTPLGARHRRGDRGGRRPSQRLYLARDHRLSRQGAEGGRAARRRHHRRHPAATRCSIPTSCSASAASSCRRSARRYDTPDDIIFDQFQETALPGQPLGRPVLGTGRVGRARSAATISSTTWRATTRRSNMVLSAAGRVEHDRIVELADKYFGSVPRTPANGRPRRCAMSAATAARRACSSRPIWCWASRASAIAIPTISRSPSIRPCSAAACPRACSRQSARSAAWSTASTASTRPMPTAACSASMPAPARRTSPSLCRPSARSSRAWPARLSEAEIVRARNQIKAGILMSLE